MDKATEILNRVRETSGVSLSCVDTSGGCYTLEGRLESGHWIVCADYSDGYMEFPHRIELESERDDDDETHPMGWSIGIYPSNPEHGYWYGTDSVIDVYDADAYADALPGLVIEALQALTADKR